MLSAEENSVVECNHTGQAHTHLSPFAQLISVNVITSTAATAETTAAAALDASEDSIEC